MSLCLAIHSADAVLCWVAAALPSMLAPTAPAVKAGLLVQGADESPVVQRAGETPVVPSLADETPVGLVTDEMLVVPSTRTRKPKTQAKDKAGATAAGTGTKAPCKRSVKKTNSAAKR